MPKPPVKRPPGTANFPRKAAARKTDLRYRNGSEDGYRADISTPQIQDSETVALPSVETVAPSISRPMPEHLP